MVIFNNRSERKGTLYPFTHDAKNTRDVSAWLSASSSACAGARSNVRLHGPVVDPDDDVLEVDAEVVPLPRSRHLAGLQLALRCKRAMARKRGDHIACE